MRTKSIDRLKPVNIVKLRTYYKWRVKSRAHFGYYTQNNDNNWIMEFNKLLTGTSNEIQQEINSLSIVNNVNVASVEHISSGQMDVWITISEKEDQNNDNN